MKNLKWIIGLLIPIIAVFLAFILNQKTPDVRYTLSKGIPITSFQEEAAKTIPVEISVQELVVKNLGNIKAETVQVKIKSKVLKYDLVKNFASDEPKLIVKDGIFSLLYPELPPDGAFTLVFSSRGPGIWEKDISISDQSGLCKPAFSESKVSLVANISFLILGVIYFVMILSSIITFFVDRWKADLKYKNYYEIISKKKPFFVSNESWSEAMAGALEGKIVDDYYSSDVQESLCYKILLLIMPLVRSGT